MAQAQAKGPNSWHAVEDGGAAKINLPAEQWRTLLTEAVRGGQLSLAFFPVVRGADGTTRMVRSCLEGPVFRGDRIRWDAFSGGLCSVPEDTLGAAGMRAH